MSRILKASCASGGLRADDNGPRGQASGPLGTARPSEAGTAPGQSLRPPRLARNPHTHSRGQSAGRGVVPEDSRGDGPAPAQTDTVGQLWLIAAEG
ncbi:hypothetical protein OH76DRAFT_1405316 [Lentinus brumalis]|uniref:Uncharacterized protein n=1 Tax=Lentinus brumalis TaxID=2498619 RepID=A0A371D6B9_9APHY|nr:hypothetical protein OH76DRAFT_1405316 [Polyporus brumalis]